MTKVKIISLILFTLLLIQILPVNEVGNMLSQNQLTEELPHNAEDGDSENANVKFGHPVLLLADHLHFISQSEASAKLIYIHHQENIPSNHSNSIVSPPPDTVS